MEALLWLYIVGSLLLIVLALPLIGQKVKPNPIYGFRVRQTLENEDTWYAVNKYAGKRILLAGICMLAASIGLYFIPGMTVDAYALLCLAVFLLTFVPGIIQSWQYMKKLTEEKSISTAPPGRNFF